MVAQGQRRQARLDRITTPAAQLSRPVLIRADLRTARSGVLFRDHDGHRPVDALDAALVTKGFPHPPDPATGGLPEVTVPDYTPILIPGLTGTFIAAAQLTGGDPVEVAGTGTVQHAGAASMAYIGIAAMDAAAGARVTVIMDRVVHEGPADGAINARDQLVPSAVPGRQVKTAPAAVLGDAADVNAARAVCGIALTTATD